MRFGMLCCLMVFAFFVPVKGFADETFPVEFAVLLTEGDPVSGSATCMVDKQCQLLDSKLPGFEISLKVHSGQGGVTGELMVSCEKACSFENERPKVDFVYKRGARLRFGFKKGAPGIWVPLVLMPKSGIGEILLVFP
ncbi:hypothetical protein [Neorhizobium alkalisoli]|uniref:Uncharacterized protein n=1 Tax=Neorhizobium alkalisoli TaxID=528178 RepID=A0A561QHG7_9HYPH|nr:hypothetical protein [Neorhizobium alkalisoli]TWF49779.1 hypothetical protein FHW37_107146 [Neorhizobium alkalisoli]